MYKVTHAIDTINHGIKPLGYIIRHIRGKIFNLYTLVHYLNRQESGSHWAFSKSFTKKIDLITHINRLVEESKKVAPSEAVPE